MATQILGTVPISQLPEILVDLTSTDWLVVAKDINTSPLNRLKNARDFAVATRDEAVNIAVPQAVGQAIALLPTLVPLPLRASIFADEMVVVTGAALSTTIDNLQQHNFYVNQSPSAVADNTRAITPLDTAGTYFLTALYATTATGGQYDVVVNGIVVLSIDAYSAGTTQNVSATSAAFTVSDATVTINVVTTGQNGSSAGFDTNLTKLYIN